MANADAAKIEYINEHLFYEYEMLQYSLDKLKSCTDQLDWNAYFVSFVVFGRNLYRFLLNRRDNRTFRVGDFTDGYRPPKPGQIAGIIQKLDAQVLHLGKGRTKLPEGKAGIVAVTQ